MTNTNLNQNETKVLNAVHQNTMDCTGGEFGWTNEIEHEDFSQRQIAGYLSSLQKKGMIIIWDNASDSGSDVNENQVELTEAGLAAIEIKTEANDTIEAKVEIALTDNRKIALKKATPKGFLKFETVGTLTPTYIRLVTRKLEAAFGEIAPMSYDKTGTLITRVNA